MGTGKSTIGKRLAELLRRKYIDTDALIVARAGKPIPKIFAEDGETHFREMERNLAVELAAQTDLVISTGGGMLVDEANRAAFMQSGFVVCLDAPPELIQKRLARAKDRPLAPNWRELYEKRREIYALIPAHVDVTSGTPDRTAREIIRLWRSSP
jgi:shikimate kinase